MSVQHPVAPGADSVAIDPVQHIGLVRATARRYLHAGLARGLDLEELVSEGMFGLLCAARAFDPGRGRKFSTLAVLAIRQRLQLALRRAKPMKRLSQDEHGEPIDLPAPDAPDEVEAEELLGRLLRFLPANHRVALELRFGLPDGQGRDLEEVGHALGVSRSRAGQLVEKGIDRLRKEAGRIGLG